MENIMEKRFFYTEIYQCPNCKSEIKMSNSDEGKKCLYCGSMTYLKSEKDASSIMDTGTYVSRIRPEYMLHFAVTENEAIDIVKKYWKDFGRRGSKIVSVKPVYLPHALYDISVREEKIINNTDNINLEKFSFKKVPVLVSDKYVDENLFFIDQFNLNYLVEFDDKKISESYAELLVDGSEIANREKKELKYEFVSNNIAKIPKYASAFQKYADFIDFNNDIVFDKIEYALLPFWFVSVAHKNKKYITLVNGQSGKAMGDTSRRGKDFKGRAESIIFREPYYSKSIYSKK